MGCKLYIYKSFFKESSLMGVLDVLWVSLFLYKLVPNMWATYAILIYWVY
jgi:hypothetical protein